MITVLQDDDRIARLRIIYEEAVRNIEGQRQEVDDLRGRTGYLLAGTTIATSFLGGIALKTAGSTENPLIWFALGSFVLVGLLVLCVLFPQRWRFYLRIRPTDARRGLLGTYVDGPPSRDLAFMYRRLAERHDRNRLQNLKGLRRLQLFFRIAVVSTIIEIVLWVIFIAISQTK